MLAIRVSLVAATLAFVAFFQAQAVEARTITASGQGTFGKPGEDHLWRLLRPAAGLLPGTLHHLSTSWSEALLWLLRRHRYRPY